MAVEVAQPVAMADGWSAVARKDAAPPVKVTVNANAVRSKSGLSTIVVDTNAVIGSGAHLLGSAERFVTVREVLEEVRDPMSRMNLAALPIKLEIMEPEAEAFTKVLQFAKATGDLQSLSEVDLKLIALAYTLEAQVHGVSHLRTRPPPLQVTPVQKNKLRDPPGWGSNVANLKEWEQLSEAENKSRRENKSKILGLKYLNLDGSEAERAPADVESNQSETPSTAGSTGPRREGRPRREKSAPKPKPVYSIEGKKNVAVGLDASKTQPAEVEDTSDWVHACSRTTRRKFLKREARRQAQAVADAETTEATTEATEVSEATVKDLQQPQKSFFEAEPELPLVDEDDDEDTEDVTEERNESTTDDGAESAVLGTERGKLDDDEEGASGSEGDEEDTRAFAAEMAAHEGNGSEDLQPEGQESIATSNSGGVASSTPSENYLTTNPSWQSSIACATGDFAMQNVILQMGLRLLSHTGIHVRELTRWVLKCTACGKITPEVGRIFCPKCGNGGTLYKVSVTVGANGSVHAGQIKRVNLRGTRYSLPLPKGGRVGAAQNPILREDQLPHRVLNPKQKKPSPNAGGDVFVTADSLFTNNKGMQNIGLMPAVQQASAVFSGRRNPNERRNNRKH